MAGFVTMNLFHFDKGLSAGVFQLVVVILAVFDVMDKPLASSMMHPF